MTTSTRRIAALVAIASVVLAAIWYFTLWAPESKHLAAAHAAEDAAGLQTSQLDSQLAVLNGLVKKIPADNAALAKLKSGIPDSPSLDTALDQLHQVAVSSGVDLTSIGPSNPFGQQNGPAQATTSGLPAITLAMAVTGSPTGVMNFVQALTTMPRVLVITSLNFTTGNPTTAQITARIFYANAVSASP